MLGLFANLTQTVFVQLYLCICMSDTREHCFCGPRTITFQKIQHMFGLSATLTKAVFVYLWICVFVFVYQHVRHLGTLFLRSSCHYLLKNIAHVRSICNFDRSCICVFVHLCICICVFARQTPGNIVFQVLVLLPFQKCSTCQVYPQL